MSQKSKIEIRDKLYDKLYKEYGDRIAVFVSSMPDSYRNSLRDDDDSTQFSIVCDIITRAFIMALIEHKMILASDKPISAPASDSAHDSESNEYAIPREPDSDDLNKALGIAKDRFQEIYSIGNGIAEQIGNGDLPRPSDAIIKIADIPGLSALERSLIAYAVSRAVANA